MQPEKAEKKCCQKPLIECISIFLMNTTLTTMQSPKQMMSTAGSLMLVYAHYTC